MSPPLAGRVALVTGGSSGIGRAAALAFADAGATVVLAARGVERGEAVAREVEERGGRALFVRADVSRAADVETLLRRTIGAYGRLDCAFNNAASVDGAGRLTGEFDEGEFDRAVAASLKSVWLCMKYELAQMLTQRPASGAIVNTSSVNGLGGARGGALYSAAKAGVLALTKSAAQEYAAQGIRVNALVAGAFRTPMLERAFEMVGKEMPGGAAAAEAAYAKLSPLGRIGRPEEAAAAAVWLCSDAASFVTGSSMIVDGGMTAALR